jgi:exodeoxyribonuclease III
LFKLTSLNLNGIRSATRKGVEAWLEKASPDCICVQEIKAQAADVVGNFRHLGRFDRATFISPKKRATQAWASTHATSPSDVIVGFDGGEFDAEGRYIELRFDTPTQKLSIISSYFPSGSSGPERQEAKFRFLSGHVPAFDTR